MDHEKPDSKVVLPVGVVNSLRRRMAEGGDLYDTRTSMPALRAQYPGTSAAAFKLVIEVLHGEGLVSPPKPGVGLWIGPLGPLLESLRVASGRVESPSESIVTDLPKVAAAISPPTMHPAHSDEQAFVNGLAAKIAAHPSPFSEAHMSMVCEYIDSVNFFEGNRMHPNAQSSAGEAHGLRSALLILDGAYDKLAS